MHTAMNEHSRTKSLLHAAIIVAFAIVAYLPSFDVPFTFDDAPNIVMNPAVHADSVGDVADAGRVTIGGNPRVLAMMSFAANHLFDGLDPFYYHLVNLTIHAVNGLLLYALLLQLFAVCPPVRRPSAAIHLAAPTAAMFAALIWTLNPVNTQAVTYVVQRVTSLSVLFYLLALLAFVLYRRERMSPWWTLAIVLTCFIAGMATKKIIVTLPAALWLIDVILLGRYARVHRIALAGIGVLAGVMIAVYASAPLAGFWHQLPGRDFSGYERLLTQGGILWHYLGLYLLPLPDRLQLDYHWPISHGLLDPAWTVVAWGGWLAAVAAAWRWRATCPWPAMAVLFFLAASAVEASFLNLELVFEHRVYLPSLFIAPALLAVIPWQRLGGGRTVLLWGLVALLALGTIERNRQWAEFEGFWVEELKRGASPDRAAINSALRYNRIGQAERALAVLDGVSRRHGTNAKMEQQRAEALLGLGRFAEAEQHIKLALDRFPGWHRAHYFHGQIMLQQGEVNSARELAERMRAGSDKSVYAVSLLALVLQHENRPREAIDFLKSYLADPPDLSGSATNLARSHLANLYLAIDRPQQALEVYRAIIEHDSENFHAWAQVYRLLRAGGDAERAGDVKRLLEKWNVDPSAWEASRDGRKQ